MKEIKSLTSPECVVVNIISRRTKLDCWFQLRHDKNGTDYVWDLEYRKRMSLRDGVELLAAALEYNKSYENCHLTDSQDLVFRNLLKRLNIPFEDNDGKDKC